MAYKKEHQAFIFGMRFLCFLIYMWYSISKVITVFCFCVVMLFVYYIIYDFNVKPL